LHRRNPVLRDPAGHRHAHRTERASLGHRERPDPRRDALEPDSIIGRKTRQRPRQLRAVVIQRRVRQHVSEPLGVLAQGDFPVCPDGLDDARRGGARPGVEARAAAGQLGDRATGQQG